MKRRTLLGASFATLPLARALAAERTIGWISPELRETTLPFFNAFMAGLKAIRGGEQVKVLERNVTGGPDAIAATVRDLEKQGVGLIVSQGGATLGVARAKPGVPQVFGYSADPVAAGVVQSLARPGGNATGVTFMSVELMPKRVDLLRSALPRARKIGLLSNTAHFGEENEIVACQRAVEVSGVELLVYRVSAMGEIKAAVERALDDRVEALVVLPSSVMVRQAPVIATQLMAHKIPLVSGWASIAKSGALLTYGPNLDEAYKRVAHYAMRVLAGAHPSTLPVEQPSVLELIVNMRTANALGLTFPPNLLAQANEVIE
jgi:putative ABC transport system substrate-binding protein